VGYGDGLVEEADKLHQQLRENPPKLSGQGTPAVDEWTESWEGVQKDTVVSSSTAHSSWQPLG